MTPEERNEMRRLNELDTHMRAMWHVQQKKSSLPATMAMRAEVTKMLDEARDSRNFHQDNLQPKDILVGAIGLIAVKYNPKCWCETAAKLRYNFTPAAYLRELENPKNWKGEPERDGTCTYMPPIPAGMFAELQMQIGRRFQKWFGEDEIARMFFHIAVDWVPDPWVQGILPSDFLDYACCFGPSAKGIDDLVWASVITTGSWAEPDIEVAVAHTIIMTAFRLGHFDFAGSWDGAVMGTLGAIRKQKYENRPTVKACDEALSSNMNDQLEVAHRTKLFLENAHTAIGANSSTRLWKGLNKQPRKWFEDRLR